MVLLSNIEEARLKSQGKIKNFEFKGKGFRVVGPVNVPINLGSVRDDFEIFAFIKDDDSSKELENTYYFISYNYAEKSTNPMVRIHSGCVTGDVFGSMRCDCGSQLEYALQKISDNGEGGVLYIQDHEGRGIGGWNKMVSYLLQEDGFDTYEANKALGFDDDKRDYFAASAILNYMFPKMKSVRLLSNNPEKAKQLELLGIKVGSFDPIVTGHSIHNKRYIEAKIKKNHMFTYTKE